MPDKDFFASQIPEKSIFGIRKGRPKAAKSLSSNEYLAEWTGLEPATPGMTGRYQFSRIGAG